MGTHQIKCVTPYRTKWTYQILCQLLDHRLVLHRPRPGVANETQIKVVCVSCIPLTVDAHRITNYLVAERVPDQTITDSVKHRPRFAPNVPNLRFNLHGQNASLQRRLGNNVHVYRIENVLGHVTFGLLEMQISESAQMWCLSTYLTGDLWSGHRMEFAEEYATNWTFPAAALVELRCVGVRRHIRSSIHVWLPCSVGKFFTSSESSDLLRISPENSV